jgi:nucleoside-diphosphate-sugar epimerase
MKILLTGASGFLGTTINVINEKKHKVITVGRQKNNDIVCDLATQKPVLENIDIVIHAAGKAHSVPKTSMEQEEFLKVNFDGTRNLCYGLEKSRQMPKRFVFISTVAVYGLETGENIGEDAELIGSSPYAISKIRAELFLIDWCKKHNIIFNKTQTLHT